MSQFVPILYKGQGWLDKYGSWEQYEVWRFSHFILVHYALQQTSNSGRRQRHVTWSVTREHTSLISVNVADSIHVRDSIIQSQSSVNILGIDIDEKLTLILISIKSAARQVGK